MTPTLEELSKELEADLAGFREVTPPGYLRHISDNALAAGCLHLGLPVIAHRLWQALERQDETEIGRIRADARFAFTLARMAKNIDWGHRNEQA